jgi:uncharacterized repeat protein (TIGR02059 family)
VRYITDLEAAKIAQRVGLTLTELQIAGADAALVWRYIAANEWTSDDQMRTWAGAHGLAPDRINNAVRILASTNRLFMFEDTPISPLPTQDVTAPTLMQLAVNGTLMTLTYSESIDPSSVPAAGDLSVQVDGQAATIDTIGIAGAVVSITLDAGVTPGQVVTLAYVPGVHPIRDYSLNNAISLDAVPVENHSPLSGLSKPDLMKRAATLDIEGRSDMDKDTLIRAIQDAEATTVAERAT